MEIWIHHQAELQSSPLDIQHILEQKLQSASLFVRHLPTGTHTCKVSISHCQVIITEFIQLRIREQRGWLDLLMLDYCF